MKFQFTTAEVLTNSFTRYNEVWNPGIVKLMRDKSKIVGSVDFGISELLRTGLISIDSPEFIRFCQKLRSGLGFPALTRLDTPDYPIALCVSTPNVSFFRQSSGILIDPNISDTQIELKNDLVELSRYCIAAGLIDEPAARKQYGDLRRCAREYFWPC